MKRKPVLKYCAVRPRLERIERKLETAQLTRKEAHCGSPPRPIRVPFEVNGCPKDALGNTYLQWACMKGHLLCARALVRAGANLHFLDEHQRGLLHLACDGVKQDQLSKGDENRRNELIEWLLELEEVRATVNVPDHNGSRPLHIAAMHRNIPALRCLLEVGGCCGLVSRPTYPERCSMVLIQRSDASLGTPPQRVLENGVVSTMRRSSWRQQPNALRPVSSRSCNCSG